MLKKFDDEGYMGDIQNPNHKIYNYNNENSSMSSYAGRHDSFNSMER